MTAARIHTCDSDPALVVYDRLNNIRLAIGEVRRGDDEPRHFLLWAIAAEVCLLHCSSDVPAVKILMESINEWFSIQLSETYNYPPTQIMYAFEYSGVNRLDSVFLRNT